MSGCGREALPNILKLSAGLPRCTGVVGRLSRMSRSGPETLPDVPEQ